MQIEGKAHGLILGQNHFQDQCILFVAFEPMRLKMPYK